MPPRVLLLDFDGVIADTENIHIAAWQRTLADFGWEVPDEVAARTVEVDDRVFLAELFARWKVPGGDVPGWVRRKQVLTVAMLADSPRLFHGVVELVQALPASVSLGVVTATWRENVETVLKAAGMFERFALIVAKEDVQRVKPDSECYHLALKRLEAAPAEAVALEDSASGIQAAQGAGVRVLAIGHRLPQGDWAGTADYMADLTRTPEVLRMLGLS